LRLTPSPDGGVPWDDVRKVLLGCQRMANISNGVETLPKISIALVRCTNVTDRRQTDRRSRDGRRHSDDDDYETMTATYSEPELAGNSISRCVGVEVVTENR